MFSELTLFMVLVEVWSYLCIEHDQEHLQRLLASARRVLTTIKWDYWKYDTLIKHNLQVVHTGYAQLGL